MERLSSPGRHIVTALVFSIAAHLLLFAPWRYGGWSLPSENSIEGAAASRLNVVLIPTGSSPSPGASEPILAGAPALDTVEVVKPPEPIQQAAREASPAATPPGLPMEALRYYPIKEVDQRPLMKRVPQIDADPDQMHMLVTGKAVIELLIENNGQINAVNLVQADIPDSYVQALRKAFMKVEYTPAIKSNQPVRSKLQIEISYVDGVLNSLPGPELGNLPQTPLPHVPIDLGADLHQRKKNPPPRSGN